MKIKTNKQIRLIITLIIIFITIFCTYSQAYPNTKVNYSSTNLKIADKSPDISSEQLSLYSKAAILIDSKTGKILYEKNSHEKNYPASTTKILTAIIALEKCKLTDQLTASYDAIMSIPSGYSNAAIQENEVLTVEELLNVFLIHSANEAGYILAEYISGSISKFADLMNQKALEIGCENTHFTNPSGIHDENHYSTAYDMSLIAQYCMKNDEFRRLVSKTSCTISATNKYQERYFVNTNDLIRPSSEYYYQYCIGIKTGYTRQAKNCLIAASSKDNLELITVVLGAESTETGKSARNIDTINLFNYGFSNYMLKEILSKNSVVTDITIKNATKETKDLPIICQNSISALLPQNTDLSNIKPSSISLNENLLAPISEGSIVGTIHYVIDGIEYTENLYAQHNVEEFNLSLILLQIVAVIIILIVLYKILSQKSRIPKGKKRK